MKIDQLTPTSEILRELGRRLAGVRKQQGFSQERLAAAAGVGVATLRRIEDGKDGQLGSWVRLLLALQMDTALDQLLPAEFRSPMAEALAAKVTGARRNARPRRAPKTPPTGNADPGFVWGDERP